MQDNCWVNVSFRLVVKCSKECIIMSEASNSFRVFSEMQ